MQVIISIENQGVREFETKDLGDLRLTPQSCLVGKVDKIKLNKVINQTNSRLSTYLEQQREYFITRSECMNQKIVEHFDEMYDVVQNRLIELNTIMDKCDNESSLVYSRSSITNPCSLNLESYMELRSGYFVKYSKDNRYPYMYSIDLTKFGGFEFLDSLVISELKKSGKGFEIEKSLQENDYTSTHTLFMALTFMYRDFKEGIAPEVTFKNVQKERCMPSNFEVLKEDIEAYSTVVLEKLLDVDGVRFSNKDCGNGLSTDLVHNNQVVLKTLKTAVFKTICSSLGLYPCYFLGGKLIVASKQSLDIEKLDVCIVSKDNPKISTNLKALVNEIK